MKPSVLVIDDEKSIRVTFEHFLADEGYEVLTASGYGEGLAKIAEGNPDVVFTDIVLDAMSGIDILKAVKQKSPFCPVVMITGYPDVETVSQALRLGAFDYLQKPVVRETLVHVTSRALQHRALVGEKERYRAHLEVIFKTVKEAIVLMDQDLKVLALNEAAKGICGFGPAAASKPFASLQKDCGGRCLDALTEAFEKKAPVSVARFECRHRARPAQVVAFTAYPLVDHLNQITGGIMVIRDETRLEDLERKLSRREGYHHIVGKCEKMQRIYTLMDALAEADMTVLITGESGTGKELVAEALHYSSGRRNKPLIKVTCPALSENLLESELFGHAKGAFTGAVSDRIGRFGKADGGTIFLDEVGDMSPNVQIKLLRFLQEREFERVGDSTPIKVDVRVIAATNSDLRKKVMDGDFREDLYYRLKVIELHIPSLRERRDDIPLLVDHFIKCLNQKLHRHIDCISSEVSQLFMEYAWPGNVRELEHVIEHAFLLCRQPTITLDHLPADLLEATTVPAAVPAEGTGDVRGDVLRALEKTAWNKAKAARMLGMSRSTFYRKIDEYGITPSDLFKKASP